MSDVDALVDVVMAYTRAVYTSGTEFNLLEIIELVDHSAKLFDGIERHAKHMAVNRLATIWEVDAI